MKTVKKANRVLNVDDDKLELYMRDGYDEIDETTGKVITASPIKAYSAADVEKLKADTAAKYEKTLAEKDAEIAVLRAQVEKLEKKTTKRTETSAEPAGAPAQNA